ncbi:hypothetical protein MP638_001729, partial [Amoeboaphelidium occidentale]
MSSGIQTAAFTAHSFKTMSLQLTDDTLYTGSYDAAIKAWDTKSLENVGFFAVSSQISAILFEQESLLACAGGSIEMFSVISGERNVLVEESSVCFCMVSHENLVFTGHEDSLIKVRSLYSLVSFQTYAGHLDWVASLCFDEVFNLYSASFDGTVKKWNMAARSVAYSFENKNGSVSSLGAYQNKLLVGLKSGRIDCYDTDNAMSLRSFYYHSKAVSSLNLFNDSIYSSGLDGTVLKFSSTGDGNSTTFYRSDLEPLMDLFVGRFLLVALQGATKIVLIPKNLNSISLKFIELQTPSVCVAATQSVILAGSKSGVIYAWDTKTFQVSFELKGHVSPVNNLLVVDVRLFSASDDKTII